MDELTPAHERVFGPRHVQLGRRRIGMYVRWRVQFLIGVLAWRDPEVLSMTYLAVGIGPIEVHLSFDRVFSRREQRRHGVTADDGAVLASEVEDFLAGRGPE